MDDFYLLSADREWLLSFVPKVKEFLSEKLGLSFHDGKLKITSVWHGVEFLGAWLKPNRIYISRNCVGRIRRKMDALSKESPEKWEAPLNSYCGILSHGRNYYLRHRLLIEECGFDHYGVLDFELRMFYY